MLQHEHAISWSWVTRLSDQVLEAECEAECKEQPRPRSWVLAKSTYPAFRLSQSVNRVHFVDSADVNLVHFVLRTQSISSYPAFTSHSQPSPTDSVNLRISISTHASSCQHTSRCFHKSDNKSLISTDRNNKATLLFTILRCTFKSSAKDLSPRIITLLSASKHPKPFRNEHRCQPAMVQRQ